MVFSFILVLGLYLQLICLLFHLQMSASRANDIDDGLDSKMSIFHVGREQAQGYHNLKLKTCFIIVAQGMYMVILNGVWL